ncbi:MAG: hypothetical protein H6656_10180 [Ardenticatenaceae bacterium]|nr:hypothetical protein [Ardenticatenaceae bacterium]
MQQIAGKVSERRITCGKALSLAREHRDWEISFPLFSQWQKILFCAAILLLIKPWGLRGVGMGTTSVVLMLFTHSLEVFMFRWQVGEMFLMLYVFQALFVTFHSHPGSH